LARVKDDGSDFQGYKNRMRLLQNVPLKNYNYLRFEAVAEQFAKLESCRGFQELCDLVKQKGQFHILGEGSNILLNAARFPLVIQVAIKGIDFRSKGKDVFVKAQAGENWSDFVDATTKMGLFGIECLASIPGSVGAAPVQNIGAYGQEVGSVIDQVEVLNLRTGEDKNYRGNEC
jgi:UDP-N-acetylmuramate dehydrogenase